MNDYQIPVLMYHQVLRTRSEAGKFNTYVLEKDLRKQFQYLKNKGYETITFYTLAQLDASQRNKKIILTFDDGYEDNYTILFPLLKEFGFTAVIYMVTRLQSNVWSEKQGEPRFPLMSEAQLKEMADYGVEFGGHTQTHVNFDVVSKEIARQEIEGCKADLEKILKKNVISFAYPFGAINDHVKLMVKESGHLYGVATNTGPYLIDDDHYRVRRIQISYRTRLVTFIFKVSGYYHKKASALLSVIGLRSRA